MPVISDSNYLQDNISIFFNALVNNCTAVTGDKSLLSNLFDCIISLQYDSINKVVFIETPEHNYFLTEIGDKLRL